MDILTCPGCGFPTLDERGSYEICAVCHWEDDNQDDESADEIWGGPNSDLSLTENRINIGKIFNELANNLHGNINLNPTEVLEILAAHEKRMKVMTSKISDTTDISDPLWTEYGQERKKVIEDLIKWQ